MTTDKALNRIFWRFGGNDNKYPFKVNETDVEAYNTLNEYVHDTQKKIVQYNPLFAKLYIYMVMKIMEQKRTTVFDNVARKQIGNILKMPIEQLIENLTDSLNESDLYELFQNEGVIMKHPALRTDQENEHNKETVSNITPEQIQQKPWNYQDVNEAIIAEINLMIELHG